MPTSLTNQIVSTSESKQSPIILPLLPWLTFNRCSVNINMNRTLYHFLHYLSHFICTSGQTMNLRNTAPPTSRQTSKDFLSPQPPLDTPHDMALPTHQRADPEENHHLSACGIKSTNADQNSSWDQLDPGP